MFPVSDGLIRLDTLHSLTPNRLRKRTMVTYRRGGYVQHNDDAVERACEHCGWHGVADSYPALIRAYQAHLRREHPRAWVRS
ncbi:hypothetical protein [Halorubrum vacuolatum]|nr:hypothetical protein [Halorubrum vacuolatum]